MKFLSVGLLLVLLLTGCTSSGVVPMGRDTYMLTKSGSAIGTGSSIKADLYREADSWTKSRGLVMVPVSEKSVDGIAGTTRASAEIVFRAVKTGDYEDQRTNLKKPEQTIRLISETPERRDNHGLTAEAYDRAAKKYEAEGDQVMAEMARKKAESLR